MWPISRVDTFFQRPQEVYLNDYVSPREARYGLAGYFHFHNFVHVSDFDAMRRKKVRFVIFHRDAAPGPNDGREPRTAAVERWRREYIERMGKPVFESKSLSVFDLQPAR